MPDFYVPRSKREILAFFSIHRPNFVKEARKWPIKRVFAVYYRVRREIEAKNRAFYPE